MLSKILSRLYENHLIEVVTLLIKVKLKNIAYYIATMHSRLRVVGSKYFKEQFQIPL